MRRIFLGLIVGLWLVPGWVRASSLTAGDVLSRARVYLRDQSTTANRQQFPDTTLLQFLSDGQREATQELGMPEEEFTFPLVLGTTGYALDLRFVAMERVYLQIPGQPQVKIFETTQDQLDAQSQGWQSATGAPTKYWILRNAGLTTPLSIEFYPAPSVSGSTGTITYWALESPPDVTLTTSYPFSANPFLQPAVPALADYVAFRGFMSVEETDLATIYFNKWTAEIALIKKALFRTPDFNPGFVGQHGSP